MGLAKETVEPTPRRWMWVAAFLAATFVATIALLASITPDREADHRPAIETAP